MAGRALPAGRHRRVDARRHDARREGQPPEREAIARGRRRDVRRSTPSSASPRRTRGSADLLRARRRPVVARGQQGRRDSREAPSGSSMQLGLGEPDPVERAARPRHRRPARHIVALLPEPAPRTEDDAATDGDDEGLLGRARGPAQRRQVDALQPADRRGARRRARHARHHPRQRSTRSSRPRTARSASSTPPACGARRRSTRAPSTTRWCGRCRRWTRPTSRCW